MKISVVRAGSVTSTIRAMLSTPRRHYRELVAGGLPTLARKGTSVLSMLIACPILLIVYALRPLVLIRFGVLYSTRIGHLAANTELYLCQRDADTSGKRTLDLFAHIFPVCNQQLKKMWGRKLRITPLARPLYTANCHLPGGRRHLITMPSSMGDTDGLLPRTDMHISFTPEEELWGQRALLEMGIPEGSPFICFYSRDIVYLDSISPNQPRRDQDYRNASINNCVPMAEEMARRGYYVLRMGAAVEECLPSIHPMVIDYATQFRSDFMDIFLSAKCHFFLGSTGGINGVARIFRRPVVYVNFVPLGHDHLRLASAAASLVVPKKLWLRQEGKFMTFSEIVESGAGDYFHGEPYESLGIEIIENTAEEIHSVAVEMEERSQGTWQSREDDQGLQRRFWDIFKVDDPIEEFRPRIGTEFLRLNRGLLD